MNKQRRKALSSLEDDINQIKNKLEGMEEGKFDKELLQDLVGKAADVQSQLETLRDEEQEYYDNMPEGLQAGEKGDKATEVIDYLESAITEVETAHDSIEEALNEEASEEDREGMLEAANDEFDNAVSSIQSAVE